MAHRGSAPTLIDASSSVNLTIRPGVKTDISQIARIPIPLPGKPRSMSTGPAVVSFEGMALVNQAAMRHRIENIGRRFPINRVDDKVYEYMTLALQERLRSVVEELVVISRKRTDDPGPSYFTFTETSDTKSSLREIERREREETERRERDQRQRLLEEARANRKNKAMQERVSRVVQDEENKSTDNTAFLALGTKRGRPKVNQPSSSAAPPRGLGTPLVSSKYKHHHY